MENLFKEFSPANAAEWKQQLLKDLKGEDPASLNWQNENGFVLKPYYTAEDLKQDYSPAFTHAEWQICAKVSGSDAAELNQRMLRQLNQGATSLEIRYSGNDFESLLEGISLPHIRAVFFLKRSGLHELSAYLEKKHGLANLSICFFSTDIEKESDFSDWLEKARGLGSMPAIRYVSADLSPFHNMACNAQYEIALAISALVAKLQTLSGDGSRQFAVKLGVSSDFFVQIAKFRALRRLWECIKKEYGLSHDLYVIAETSLANKSLGDRHNNLLRSTVEAMAAVLGGCNELVVNEFDVLFPEPTQLGERLALNQQLILREESYLDKMADVSCGSYYIEHLTDALAGQALETVKAISRKGGYYACLSAGVFEQEVSTQRQQQVDHISSLQSLVIGVNKYRNGQEPVAPDEAQLKRFQEQFPYNPVLNYELNNLAAE